MGNRIRQRSARALAQEFLESTECVLSPESWQIRVETQPEDGKDSGGVSAWGFRVDHRIFGQPYMIWVPKDGSPISSHIIARENYHL